MDILDSLEVRWFLPDVHATVQAASAWFAHVSPEAYRTDDYLVTGRTDLGFKVRGVLRQPTKVETKYRSGSLGAVQVAPQVVGNLERWSKLSLCVDDATLEKDGTWIAVEKERRLRKFAFQDGRVFEVGPNAEPRPSAGCSVELTRLRLRPDDDLVSQEWTLGFEAFGPLFMLLEILQAACRTAFGSAGPNIALSRELSRGYPEWLAANQKTPVIS